MIPNTKHDRYVRVNDSHPLHGGVVGKVVHNDGSPLIAVSPRSGPFFYVYREDVSPCAAPEWADQ